MTVFGKILRRTAFGCTMLMVALALAISPATDTPILAENYAEAVNRVSADLRSKDPNTRAAAIEIIAATGETQAVTMTLDTMTRETDPGAAKAMGNAVRHFSSGRTLSMVESRVLKLTQQAQAFQAFWILTGVANAKTEAADEVLGKALKESKEKDFWIRAAAMEAIADSGRADLTPLVEFALKNHSKVHEADGAIYPITATTTAVRIATGKERFPIVSALADMLETYQNDRIKFFAAQACARITGKKAFYDPYYWRDWVKMEGELSGGEAEARASRTAIRKVPKFFDAEAVGNRAIFVIDVSGSMQGPVNVKPSPPPPPKKEEEKGPITGKGRKKDGDKDEKKAPDPPDYSKVKTKLDLAKVELIYTLEQLDETYEVNVVTYHSTHEFLIPSRQNFMKATEANKKLLIDKVRALTPQGATNIHGALMRAFETGPKGLVKTDPATDAVAISSGVDTIFFLTDGHPNVCDEMVVNNSRQAGVPNPPAHPFSEPEGILSDIRRVNTFRKVVIHTVGIGPHAGGLLRSLSDSSGGTYRDMSGN